MTLNIECYATPTTSLSGFLRSTVVPIGLTQPPVGDLPP